MLPRSAPQVYTVVCFLPAVFVLNRSPFWSNAFLIFVFGVATWNGANFYVEVRPLLFLRPSLLLSCPSRLHLPAASRTRHLSNSNSNAD